MGWSYSHWGPENPSLLIQDAPLSHTFESHTYQAGEVGHQEKA